MLSRYSRRASSYRRPFYKTRGFRFLVILILITTGFVYWSINNAQTNIIAQQTQTNAPQDFSQSARLVSLEGSASVKIAGTNDWEGLNVNSELRANDTIKTDGAGKAVLQLPDKSFIRMDANTEIQIKQLSLADAEIVQTYGRAFHRVNDSTPLIYKVQHSRVELTALGTAFDVAIVGQTVEVLALANETKVKIYNESDDSLINLETIEQGKKAVINTNLEKEKMIAISNINQADLMADAWFAWNKNLDKQNNYFLGMLGDLLDLTISDPASIETTTNNGDFVIKGKTDSTATILINGNKTENKNGSFEYKVALKPGANKIQVSAQKGNFENKKNLTITYEAKETVAENAKINLTATQANGEIRLSWTLENIQNPGNFITLVSNNPAPTYPAAPSHIIAGAVNTDIWKGLESGKYYVKICLKQGDGCGIYSNEIILNP